LPPTSYVDEVVRGAAPDELEIRGLKSGLPLVGSQGCRQNAMLHADTGDVLAIAFDGTVDGRTGVNTAAWISGERSVRGASDLSLAEMKRFARALPDTGIASSQVAALTPDEIQSAWLLASLFMVAAVVSIADRRRSNPSASDVA